MILSLSRKTSTWFFANISVESACTLLQFVAACLMFTVTLTVNNAYVFLKNRYKHIIKIINRATNDINK